MRKIYNIDKIRAAACLLVLGYHCWALCGGNGIRLPVLREYISYGGVIGVTIFFVLSGYGIYSSLLATERSGGKIAFGKFMGKRIRRVVPHYYLNLLVVLLFTGSAVYLTLPHVNNILSHLFFFHNFYFDWHGAINGSLWTMAVIFQFYLIAIPLYFFVKKCRHWAVVAAVAFTVAAQYVTMNHLWVLDETVMGSFAFSIPGRQLWTSLDNFVIGMYAAHLVNSKPQSRRHWPWAIGGILCAAAIYGHCLLGNRYGVWGRELWNFVYHSILALIIGVLFLCAANMKNNRDSLISRALLWVGKYEYGIYLWHLPIINNLLAHSALLQAMLTPRRIILAYVMLVTCSVVTGVVMTRLVSGLPLLPAKPAANKETQAS